MRTHITTLALLLLLSGLLRAADGEKPPKAYDGDSKHIIDRSSPDLTKAGKWGEWKLWYIFKGTRSEGLHGELTIDDEKRNGKKMAETIEVYGRVWIWHGSWNERKHLFSKSGWLPEEIATVYPSLNLEPEQAEP